MALILTSPAQALNSYRKSDAVILVCQNNEKKTIEITGVNEEAARISGFTAAELTGKPLDAMLPSRIASTIAEYVEFEEGANDLLAVLSKIRSFAVRTADGREAEFSLRVIRGESVDRNPWFHLVLVDEEKERRNNAFRELLAQNFKGHEVLDARSDLPNRASILKDLELVTYHVREKDVSAAFAIIDINHYESLIKEYGAEIVTKLYRHIAQVCKQKLRTEDVVGTLSDRAFGIILVDAVQEPARMVLNRLRWAIGVSPLELPKKDLLAQVNVSFAPLDGKIRETEVLEKCEAFMKEQRSQVHNNVQLVVTHERRGELQQADRRKVNIPVEFDRRRRDRRGS